MLDLVCLTIFWADDSHVTPPICYLALYSFCVPGFLHNFVICHYLHCTYTLASCLAFWTLDFFLNSASDDLRTPGRYHRRCLLLLFCLFYRRPHAGVEESNLVWWNFYCL